MNTKWIFAVVPVLLFGARSADAHFKLEQPADWLQTDATGDPLSGTQKMNPCGEGTASGAVTKVAAGSTLHVKLVETVPHGGHYRVAYVPKLDPASADLPEPAVTLSGGQCDTAAIESPVAAPVLADGLFVHTQAEATAGKVWETDVRVPNEIGKGTLQIIEFMAPHAPQCFYHHCAQLEIVAADAAGDGGPSGGAVGGDGGSPGAGGDGSNGPSGGSNGGSSGGSNGGSSGGCAVGAGATPSLLAIAPLGIALLSAVRRRRRRA